MSDFDANLPQQTLCDLYFRLLLVRRTEERVAEIYPSDKIKSPVHLSIGQEAIAVAFCTPLNKTDIVSITYRGHAAYLAKGGNLNQMMAELYGKATGCAGGIAGSMHLVDMTNGILGASAVVGTNIPVAAGYAKAISMKRDAKIVVCFLGDGATEEGVFQETLNFSALHHLPIMFVCENNDLAIHTETSKRWARNGLIERVKATGIPAYCFEDMNILELYQFAQNSYSAMRSDPAHGPIFVECKTYRWLQHVGPNDDHELDYRDTAEAQRWRDRDQVKHLAEQLPDATRTKIQADVDELVELSIQFAESSPFPEPGSDAGLVYA